MPPFYAPLQPDASSFALRAGEYSRRSSTPRAQSRRAFLQCAASGVVALASGVRPSGEAADAPGTPTLERVLAYYATSQGMSRGGAHDRVLAGLPSGIGELVKSIQGVLLHEHWAAAYGVNLSEERRRESHLRPVGPILDRLQPMDAGSAFAARPLETRLVGTCRHFALLVVAALRAKGLPARARCGFASYFDTGAFEDHWVAECWNQAHGRWQLVDAQIDVFQRDKLRINFDLLDVPRDRFVVAGEAWVRCRRGEADASSFGMSPLKKSGLWFIAGNAVRDLAALNKVEMCRGTSGERCPHPTIRCPWKP